MLKNRKIKLLKKFLPFIIGFLYVISPIDIIPDFIGGIGWLDDISVVGLMFLWFLKMFKFSDKPSSYSQTEKKEVKRQKEEDPYKILGIARGETRDEVKSAYVKFAGQYHPDKV